MSDVWFIVHGEHFELEGKTGNAVLSKDQKNWREICKTMGAHFLEVRDVETAIKQIKMIIKKRSPEQTDDL